jgi:hypothetical protein
VLQSYGRTLKDQQRQYAEYVEQGLMRESDDPFAAAAAQCIIGSDDFVDRIRRAYLSVSERSNVRREQSEAARLYSWCSFEDVQAVVAAWYGCEPDTLLGRYQRGNEARQMLLYLVSTYCRGRYTLVELSERLNISRAGLTAGCRLRRDRAGKDRALRCRLQEAEARLRE